MNIRSSYCFLVSIGASLWPWAGLRTKPQHFESFYFSSFEASTRSSAEHIVRRDLGGLGQLRRRRRGQAACLAREIPEYLSHRHARFDRPAGGAQAIAGHEGAEGI